MKKLVAVMSSCVAAFSLALPVLATDELNVWVDANELVVEESNVTASVYSDGTNTDGQLVITYNAEELTLTEDDIVVGENIEMYSANIVEEGTLKIAYLGTTTDKEETIFTLNFTTENEEVSEDALAIDGVAYDNEGDELTIGVKAKEEPSNPEEPTDPEKPGDSADTGDYNNIALYSALVIIALAGIVFLSKKTKESK